jgi:hypothetical protein
MNKKIILSSFASLLFLSQAANAEIKVGNAGTITGSITVASQYISKGEDFNRDKPTTYLFGEFASNTDVQLILGATAFYSRPNLPVAEADADYKYELDYNVGLRKTFDKLTLDIGYLVVSFPSAADRFNLDTGAYTAKATLAATKNTTLSLYAEKDDTGGARPASNETPTGKVAQYYYELALSHNLGPANINLSYGNLKDYISFYKVGLSKEVAGFNIGVDYIDHDRDSKTWNAPINQEKFLVFAISKSF